MVEGKGRTSFLGIPLGKPRERLAPYEVQFRESGIAISTSTVKLIRGGFHNGERIAVRMRAAEVLRENDPSYKDNFYLSIAQKGQEIRRSQKLHSHRYLSIGFIESLAEAFSLTPNEMRRTFRAMRADMLSTQNAEYDPSLAGFFSDTASLYLADFTTPDNTTTSAPIRDLKQMWSEQGVRSFYDAIAAIGNQRGSQKIISTFAAYEVDPLAEFYGRRMEKTSPLSPLDRTTLSATAMHKPTDATLQTVHDQLGIQTVRSVLTIHANALMFGNAIAKYRE